MYGHFILIGDRLERYKVDPRITSLPERPPRRPRRPRGGGRRATPVEPVSDVELFLRNGGFSG